MSELDSFFVKYRAKTTGPHSRDEIATMVHKGTLSPVHRVSIDQQNWHPLHEIEGWRRLWPQGTEAFAPLARALSEPPPLPPTAGQGPPVDDDRDEPLDVELLD